MIIRKTLVAAAAIVAVVLAGCNDPKSKTPAQNAQPAGEQTIVGKDQNDPKGKGKARSMPKPPPIEPVK
jgi:PBP1b-binding outer membrane lipoprotein LpoB